MSESTCHSTILCSSFPNLHIIFVYISVVALLSATIAVSDTGRYDQWWKDDLALLAKPAGWGMLMPCWCYWLTNSTALFVDSCNLPCETGHRLLQMVPCIAKRVEFYGCPNPEHLTNRFRKERAPD